jgi:AraC family transcriptional regulator, positive regulator of tynA and feaB
MPIAFTTEQLDERDRIPYWVDVASKAFFQHGFDAPDPAFSARLQAAKLDNLMLSRLDCAPCTVTRDHRDARRDHIDDYILTIRLEGRSVFTQDDRTVVMQPGTVLFHNAGKPLSLEFLEPTRSMHLSIPRRLLRSRVPDADTMRLISSDVPAVGLAVDFIRSLSARVEKLDPMLMPRLATQVVDLLALALSGEQGAGLSTARANALRRVKAEIEKRLRDPNLNPARVADGAGVSIRYANSLLAEEGSSLERYILRRRLEECRRALEDPMQVPRMVGEIAFEWGFSDHSHFTRRFKDAFDMTPSECRQMTAPA